MIFIIIDYDFEKGLPNLTTPQLTKHYNISDPLISNWVHETVQ